jgi:hypothetical protein
MQRNVSPRLLLEEAERLDGYRAACAACPLNAAARSSNSYTPFFTDPTRAEELLALADTVPLCRSADIVLLHPSAEAGYPHTRPLNLICLPISVLESSTSALRTTLLHEAIHLHQRDQSQAWIAATQREGWIPIPHQQIPSLLRSRCRLNPDTLAPHRFWAWEGVHVPLPLFIPKQPLGLGDVTIKWLDLRNGGLYPPPSSFEARYGHPSQPEHPWEILAVQFSDKGLATRQDLEAALAAT